jgi:hypothetical protein
VKRCTNFTFGICVINWVMASFTWGNISVHWTFHFSLQISIREPKVGRPRWQNAPWNYLLAGNIALKLKGDMSCGRCSTILLEAVTGNVFSFKLSLKGSQLTTMFRVDNFPISHTRLLIMQWCLHYLMLIKRQSHTALVGVSTPGQMSIPVA